MSPTYLPALYAVVGPVGATGAGAGVLTEETGAGAASAAQVGEVVSVQVIPRPHDELSGLGKWLS